MKTRAIALLISLLSLAVAHTAAQSSYETVSVTDGGTIVGTVKWAGPVPKIPTFLINKDPEICDPQAQKKRDLERLVVASNGGVANTVVFLKDITKGKAMDLCLTGRRMYAEEAERSGLVSRVVPADCLQDEAMNVADKIANLSQHAVMMIKEAINRGFATTLAEGARFERGQFYSLFATEDQKEGMAAFIEKRPPVFTNR